MLGYINEEERTCAAYHEAGHVVAYLYFGHPVLVASLEPELHNNLMYSLSYVDSLSKKHYYNLKNLIDLKKLSHEVLVSASAGWEAEKIFNPELKDECGGIKWSSKEQTDSAYIRFGNEIEVFSISFKYCDLENYGWDCEPPFDELKRKARDILHNNWRYVKILAEALLKQNTLKDEQIKKLVPDLYSKTEKSDSVKKIWEKIMLNESTEIKQT